MESKYPEYWLEHYLICYDLSNFKPNRNDFERLAELYIKCEGINSLKALVEEVNLIDANNDWNYFVELIERLEINLNREQLKELAYIAMKVLFLSQQLRPTYIN